MLGIFVVLIAVLRGATAQSSCDCYQTDSGLTFLNRAFNDFRQVSEGKLVFPAQPPVPGPNGDEPVTSPYFDSEQFSNWGIQSWNSSAGPVDRANSRQNVYICKSTLNYPAAWSQFPVFDILILPLQPVTTLPLLLILLSVLSVLKTTNQFPSSTRWQRT